MTNKGTKVIALNTIHRTTKAGVHGDRAKGIPGVKPEVQTIQPGTVFMSSGKELDDLRAAQSVRDWSQQDEAALSRMSNVIGGGEFTEPLTEEDTGVASVKTTTKPAGAKKAAAEANKAAETTTENTDVV